MRYLPKGNKRPTILPLVAKVDFRGKMTRFWPKGNDSAAVSPSRINLLAPARFNGKIQRATDYVVAANHKAITELQ